MRILLILVSFVWCHVAHAAVRTQPIEYKHGDTVLEGYLAYDDANQGKRPGILIIHEWLGHNPYVRKRAEQLAELGYVAFALDMYGKGVMAKNSQEAAALASVYQKDRKLMRARAALEVLRRRSQVDAQHLAAMGYCFGGTVALELARSGADLAGIVSFHGNLTTPDTEDAKNIKGKVLVLHGAIDPFVPPNQVAAFEKEMHQGGVDWQLISNGRAVHSFTNPGAGNDPSNGVAYQEKADKRSWEAMKVFFREIFPARQ